MPWCPAPGRPEHPFPMLTPKKDWFTHRGRVVEVIDDRRTTVLLDLGFHVRIPHTFTLADDSLSFPVGTDVIVSGSLEDNGPWIVRLKPGDDENAAYSMWRYHATLIRVVDGDTFDARVNLRFSVTIDERFRLEAIAAPEIFGVDHEQPEYARGVAAKAFLEERFRANGGSMILHSSRRGKWRRWLAWVFAPAGQKVLNVQLLDAGLADYAPAGRPRNTRKVNSRISVTLEPDLRARLTERAEATDQTPREVVHDAIIEYLEPQ